MATVEGSPLTPSLGAELDGVVAAAQANAPWAYRVLFDALGPPVAGYLRASGVEDPDGLANEVFLRAFTRIETFTGEGQQFRAWVFTIAHNLVIDDRRRRSRRVRPEPLTPAHADRVVAPAAEDVALAGIADVSLRRLIDGLPTDQRDVLMLRIVADLTVPQISAALGKSVGAVKALQRRALARLRRTLDSQGVPL